MKRILRKGNPIARLVALWVVFVMVLVPLLENAGPLKKVKAISGDVKFTLNVDITKFAKVDSDNNSVIVDANNTGYAINGDNQVHKMYYWFGGNEASINIKANITGNLVKDGTNVAYQLGVKVYDADVTPSADLSAAEDLTSIDTYSEMSDEKIYAIYVKITDTNCPGTNNWYLLTSYSLQRHLIGKYSWLVEGDVYAPNGVAKSAYVLDYSKAISHSHNNGTKKYDIGAEINFPDVHLGKFEYYYAEFITNKYSIGDYAGLTSLAPGEKVTGKNGEYISFMKYCDDSGVYHDNILTTNVVLDNLAPDLTESSVAIVKGTTQTPENGIIYLDVTNGRENTSLVYSIVEDNYLADMTIKFMDGENEVASSTVGGSGNILNSNVNYRKDNFLPSELQLNTVYEVRLVLKDEANNEEFVDGKNPLLAKICLIDTNLDASCYIGNNPSDTSQKTLVSPTNTNQTINLSVTSGYPITDLSLYTGTGEELITEGDYTEYINSVGLVGKLYRYNFSIPFPGSVNGGYVKYNNLKLKVTDSNNKTKEFQLYEDANPEYIFDVNAPTLVEDSFKVIANSSEISGVKKVFYLDKDVDYTSITGQFMLDDTCLAGTIEIEISGMAGTRTATKEPGTNKYVFNMNDIDATDSTKSYIVKAKLEDSVTNGAMDGYTTLGTIKVIDKELKFVGGSLTTSDNSYSDNDILDGELKFEKVKSNKEHELNISFESGYKLESAVIRDGNNNKYAEKSFTTGEQKPNDAGLYVGTLSYTFNSETDVVTGWVVEVKDDNGKVITLPLGDFEFDKTAPTINALGVYKKISDTEYKKIEESELSDIANRKYTVDTTKKETFVVVYEVIENRSGIADGGVKHYFGNDKSKDLGSLTKSEADSFLGKLTSNEEYFVEYTTLDLLTLLNGADSVLFCAIATDVATNATELTPATYTLVVPNNQLEILEAKLTDQFGNVIDLTEINNGSYIANKKLELHVKAISGYDITTMELLTDSTVYSTTSVTSMYDINNKKYTVEQTLAIPTDISSNQLLKSIQLRVTDTGNPAMTIPVGQLLFDMSAPTINHADGSALAEDGTWYQSYNLAIAIKAGAQSVESEIDNVKYSISNSYGDKTDATDGVNYSGAAANINIDLPESYTAAGTKINVSVTDKATNSNTAAASIRVDKTNPVVDELTVNGNPYNSIPLSSSVVVKTTASDNLALAKVSMVVESEDGTKRYPKDFEYDTMAAVSDDGSRVIRNEELSLSNLADGKYNVTVTAYDKSGRVSSVKTTSFSVDSTKPVVTVKIAEGTKGGKQSSTNFDGTARDYYYSSNVGLELTYTEINLDEVVVTDNGSKVSLDWTYDSATGKHVASYKSTSEGLHQVIISAKDKTGNEAESKTIYFVKDTSAPTISAIVNGAINYTDSTGSLIFTNDSTVAYSVSDANEDKGDFNYQLIKNVPDEPVSTGDYVKTAVRTFTYTEEADYTINVFSIDMASNKSATKTVSFRLDKTAPDISIGGIGDGGSSSTPVTVSLNMQELFWSDATGTVEIYMKSGEGFGEELIEEITYTPTGRNTAISRTFSESGIYRIVFNAQDNAGHTANAESAFTIDTEVPVVTLEGVSNFDVTDKDVVISSTITEKFYASKKVTITGSVTDDTGKVTPITIDDYSPTANPTVINHTFSDDGIYDLTISCVDIVGNTDSKTVHFTIDKTNPVIGDLSDYDGKTLTSFEWDKDLDELVSDLTVCDVHMYLNGQEYNGEDAVEDGSYVLLITAEDELGHKTEKSVEFVLDTKSPVFIVTGVEDKEKKLEPYNISVSLQLEEDTLTSVTLNGKVVTITNNVATINVSEIGEYKLYMEAVDAAGNTSSAEYEFELISEKEFNFWIIIGIAALLLLIILFIILGKRKKDK